jgi:tagaturonate reductase
MKDPQLSSFVNELMMEEIAHSMNDTLVSYEESVAFANKVMDRFSNPFLLHKWLSISLNYTSKMKMRNVPLIIRYFEKFNKVPSCMALGFAAYIVFMNSRKGNDGAYHGEINGNTFVIEDEKAAFFSEQWALGNTDTIAKAVLSNTELWGTDLTQLKGFTAAVVQNMNTILAEGMVAALNKKSRE